MALLATIVAPRAALAQGSSHATTEPIALNFEATDLDGHAFAGLSLRGKIVLIDFIAVWCAPCITSIPKLNQLDRKLHDLDFQVLGIAVYSGTVEEVRAFAEEHGVGYQVVVGDEDLVYGFEVIGYPTYFLIGRHGNIVRKYVGAKPDLFDRVEADISELIESENEQNANPIGIKQQ